MISTACQGLFQLDLRDFSLEKLNIGGNYNLAEDNRPFSNGHYQDYYVGHFFRGISSDGAMLMRTQTPLPKCHGWKKHLVVPDGDGTFEIAGQSGVYSKGQIDDEELGNTFPYELRGDWLIAAESAQGEMLEEFDGGGIFALLELDNEKALQVQDQDADADTSDLPPKIGEYFDIRVDLKKVLTEAGINKLPSILTWEIDGEEKISSFYSGLHQAQAQDEDERKPVVFSQIKEESILLRQMPDDLQVLYVDDNSKEVYLEIKSDLYRLDYNAVF